MLSVSMDDNDLESAFMGHGDQMQRLKEEAKRLEAFQEQYYQDADTDEQADLWR